jgi:hypothetical protein
MQDVSCVTASYCVAVAWLGQVYTFDGTSWQQTATLDEPHALSGVSCESETFCVAIGSRYTFAFDGTTWVRELIEPIKRTVHLSSVSCVSANFCLVADQAGRVWTYDGNEWSAPAWAMSKGGYHLAACANAHLCVMVTIHGFASEYDGATWSTRHQLQTPFRYTYGVACGPGTFCTAVDYYNGYAISYTGP